MSSEPNRETAPALSAATRALFDREIAKYPADQKQSAVMACLRIRSEKLTDEFGTQQRDRAGVVGSHPRPFRSRDRQVPGGPEAIRRDGVPAHQIGKIDR